MSNKSKLKNSKVCLGSVKKLTQKQETKIMRATAPKIPKWKHIKFQKLLLKGVKRSMTLNKFRNLYNTNKKFEDEVSSVGKILIDSEFTESDRNDFFRDLKEVIGKYL